jgi:two-component system, NarL family, nitrate/nitrite response regulator NarL
MRHLSPHFADAVSDPLTPLRGKSPNRALRVLLVDDHALVCETLALALTSDEMALETVGRVDQAQDRISAHGRFDVILLDSDVPGMEGLSGMRTLVRMNQGGVVLFTGVSSRLLVDRALDAGAVGYIPKTLPLHTVRHAIRFIAEGETYLPVEYLRRSNEHVGADLGLKTREVRVLALLCEGLSNKAIGLQMGIEETTVKLDAKTIFRKLGVKNRTQAVIEARRRGLC